MYYRYYPSSLPTTTGNDNTSIENLLSNNSKVYIMMSKFNHHITQTFNPICKLSANRLLVCISFQKYNQVILTFYLAIV